VGRVVLRTVWEENIEWNLFSVQFLIRPFLINKSYCLFVFTYRQVSNITKSDLAIQIYLKPLVEPQVQEGRPGIILVILLVQPVQILTAQPLSLQVFC
jgi:hypothetical protein